MASENTLEFNSNNWDSEVEQSTVPVVVDFWATWCAPCRMLSPVMDRLADKFAGKAKVGKLNVEDAPDVAIKFGISGLPRVFLFKGGDKPRKTYAGVVSERELEAAINGLLKD